VAELKKILLVGSEYNDRLNLIFSQNELYIQSAYIGVVCLAVFRLGAQQFESYYLDSRLRSLVVGLNVKEMYDTTKKGTSNCTVVMYMKSATDPVFHVEFHNTNDCGFTEIEYPTQTVEDPLVDIEARDFDLSMPIPTCKFKDLIDQLGASGNPKVYLQLDYRGLVLLADRAQKCRSVSQYVPWIAGTTTGEGVRKLNFRYCGYFQTQILLSFAKLGQNVATQASFQVRGPVGANSPLFVQFNTTLGTCTFIAAQSLADAEGDNDPQTMLPQRVLKLLDETPANALQNDIKCMNYMNHHMRVLDWDGGNMYEPYPGPEDDAAEPPGPRYDEDSDNESVTDESEPELVMKEGDVLPLPPVPVKRAQKQSSIKRRRRNAAAAMETGADVDAGPLKRAKETEESDISTGNGPAPLLSEAVGCEDVGKRKRQPVAVRVSEVPDDVFQKRSKMLEAITRAQR